MDRFTANMIAYPGRTFGQLYHRILKGNQLATGVVRMDDRDIDLAGIAVPMLVFAGGSDGIAPVRSIRPIEDLATGAPSVRFEVVPGGHLGMLTGRAARQTTWRIIDEFLDTHATAPPRPLPRRPPGDPPRRSRPRGPPRARSRPRPPRPPRPRRRRDREEDAGEEGAREEGRRAAADEPQRRHHPGGPDRIRAQGAGAPVRQAGHAAERLLDRFEPDAPLRLRLLAVAGLSPVTAAAATAPSPDWRLAVVLGVLVAVAVTASRLGRLGVERNHVTAASRAVVQLAAVSLVITAALGSIWWSLAFALLMFSVATWTSSGRIDVPRAQVPMVGAAVAAGAVPVLALILGSGVVPFNGAGLVPTAGIVIGGAMTAATLTGRRAYDELQTSFGTYEAGLAIGLPSPEAAFEVIQPSGREALTPGLDQTRTVGLVTLPGAFVGVLLGGGTPLEAGAAQIMVLIGLMAAQAITTAVLLRLVAHGRVVRRSMAGRYPR